MNDNDSTVTTFWDFYFPVFLMFVIAISLGAILDFNPEFMYTVSFIFVCYMVYFVVGQIDR